MDESLTEHQFAEILVLGHQKRVSLVGQREHDIIRHTRLHIRYRENLMALRPQSRDHRLIDILVGQQDHTA